MTGDLLTAASSDVTFPASQNNDLLASAPGVSPRVNDSEANLAGAGPYTCLLYTSPSPRDRTRSRMPSSA